MKSVLRNMAVLLLLSLINISVFAQTTVVIPLTQGTGEDAGISGGAPSTNYGTFGSFGAYTWSCSGNLCLSRGLAKFDLSSIPAGASITNASLQLFADLNWSASPTTGGPNNGAYLSRVTSAWTENTVTWNSQPATSTSNEVLIPGSTSTTQNYTVNVTSLIQDMLTNTNYGFMIKMQDEVNYYKSLMFASSDNTVTAKCPVLTITYNMEPITTSTITLCQGNGEDAGISGGVPDTNYGTFGSFGAYTWSCSGNLCLSRGLAKFDLSSIPTGATVTNASMQLFSDLNWSTSPTTGGPNNGGYLSRITSAWTESTVTWNTQPTTTTSNQLTIPGSTSTTQDYTLNVTSLVQDMLTNTNYGFMIKMQNEVNYYKSLMFASSDNTNTAKCPILTISYQINTGINELSSQTEVIVYPNPFENEITITSSQIFQKIMIYDVMGKIYLNELVNSNNYTIRSEFPKGVYFVKIFESTNKSSVIRKIIKL